MKRVSKVHRVCEYIEQMRSLDGKCKRCPRWTNAGKYGRAKRLCRGIAEELIQLVRSKP